jgi:hypothetical protein
MLLNTIAFLQPNPSLIRIPKNILHPFQKSIRHLQRQNQLHVSNEILAQTDILLHRPL